LFDETISEMTYDTTPNPPPHSFLKRPLDRELSQPDLSRNLQAARHHAQTIPQGSRHAIFPSTIRRSTIHRRQVAVAEGSGLLQRKKSLPQPPKTLPPRWRPSPPKPKKRSVKTA
jgi:hypothetical protein